MTRDPSDALDRLVPATAANGDWNDVLGRAGVPRRRRRTALVAAVAIAVLVLVAGPAFGLFGRHVVFFGSAPSAPNVVKKQFFDLALGEPKQFASGVEPGKTRKVGTYRIGGKLHALYVAPTSNGGFCWDWQGLEGGCVRGDQRHERFEPGSSISIGRSESPRTIGIGGRVTDAATRELVVVYGDGSRADVPFVWVSAPIASGFFEFRVPAAHQAGKAQPTRLLELDSHKRTIAQYTLPQATRPRFTPPLPLPAPYHPRSLPVSGQTPTAPLQTGSGSGVTVTAGANGAVIFDTSGVDASLRKDFVRGTSYGCFKLARVFGILDVEGFGDEGRLQRTVAMQMNGVKPPFDGCQLSASIGRRWPDSLGGHAPAEIALTPKGRAYFADRAAARDVAAFVRAKHVQELRREPPAQALRDLRRTYAKPLAHSPLALVQIANGLRFSERSSTGKVFFVDVQHVGARVKITHQNLKPYGFVF